MRTCIYLIGIMIMCCGCLSTVVFGQSDSETCLRVSHFSEPSDQERLRSLGLAVFEHAGLCVELLPMPPKRSELLLKRGAIDGELMRTLVWAQANKEYAVPVPTPVIENRMLAVSLKRRGFTIEGFEDIAGLSVVLFDGHQWAETMISSIRVSPRKVSAMARFYELISQGEVGIGLIEGSVLGPMKGRAEFSFHTVGLVKYHIVLRLEHEQLVGVVDKAVQSYFEAKPH